MFKKYEGIGCGVHLNPNGGDLRCGQPDTNTFNQMSKGIALCEKCSIKKRANGLMDALKPQQVVAATDTTDIAELRSKAANVIGLLTAESLTGGFALDGLADVFDDMFRQIEEERHKGDMWYGKVADLEAALKAERQRADEVPNHVITIVNHQTEILELTERAEKAEARVGVLEGVIARKEFDAPKGDQVPVAYTGSGSLAAIKGGHEGHIWGAPAEAHPVPLYDRPQKPVVPVGFLFAANCTGAVIYSISDAAIEGAQLIGKIYGDAAIDAAGGIVKKDGADWR